jgi:hypothetical protein
MYIFTKQELLNPIIPWWMHARCGILGLFRITEPLRPAAVDIAQIGLCMLHTCYTNLKDVSDI